MTNSEFSAERAEHELRLRQMEIEADERRWSRRQAGVRSALVGFGLLLLVAVIVLGTWLLARAIGGSTDQALGYPGPGTCYDRCADDGLTFEDVMLIIQSMEEQNKCNLEDLQYLLESFYDSSATDMLRDVEIGFGYEARLRVRGCLEAVVQRNGPQTTQPPTTPSTQPPTTPTTRPPSGGTTTTTQPTSNNPPNRPRIGTLNDFTPNCDGYATITATATASDPDGDSFTIHWSNGDVGPSTTFNAGPGFGQIQAWAVDEHGAVSPTAQEGFTVDNIPSGCGSTTTTTTTTVPSGDECPPEEDDPDCVPDDPNNTGT